MSEVTESPGSAIVITRLFWSGDSRGELYMPGGVGAPSVAPPRFRPRKLVVMTIAGPCASTPVADTVTAP